MKPVLLLYFVQRLANIELSNHKKQNTANVTELKILRKGDFSIKNLYFYKNPRTIDSKMYKLIRKG